MASQVPIAAVVTVMTVEIAVTAATAGVVIAAKVVETVALIIAPTTARKVVVHRHQPQQLNTSQYITL